MDSDRPSLNDIGLKHGTDKASHGHDYLPFYERFLAPLRDAALSVLEIGVWHGQSVAMWAEYFPHGQIVGVDLDPEARQFETERIRIEIADQSNVADLVGLGRKYGPFDLIVDDGSHFWDHQLTTLRWLFPFVKPGRYYILEDIDTSYGTHAPTYRGIAELSTAQYLQRLADYMIGDAVLEIVSEKDAFIRSYARRLEFITFSRRTSVIKLRE